MDTWRHLYDSDVDVCRNCVSVCDQVVAGDKANPDAAQATLPAASLGAVPALVLAA